MRKLFCFGLAWKLILVMSMTAYGYGQDRERWANHNAHELVQPAQKDLPAPHISALGIPVDVNRNCIADPKGDVYSGNQSRTVDIAEVCGGTNGSVTEVKMAFTMMSDVYGFVCLDTDRNSETGKRFRIRDQSVKGIGCDFELDLFEVVEYGIVYITDGSGQRVGSFPARMDGNVLTLEIPLSIIKDNGNMNVAVMVGDKWGPMDWLDVPSTFAGPFGSVPGYNTWLPIFVAETAIYPAGGKFIEGMPLQVNTFLNTAPGVSVSRIRVFFNGSEPFDSFAVRGPLPVGLGFGTRFSLGRNKFLILMETNAGTFADEVEFEIVPAPLAAPTRSQPPVPASVPSSPFPTPPLPGVPGRG